jgi:hypothetical protein
MASSKPETYGVPGFSRHIMGQSELTNTLSTFSDYVRSIYASSVEEGKTPQQMAWNVYQEGYEGFQYPAAGAVLGPAGASGLREFTAATVRYHTPRGTYVDDYIKGVVKQQRTQAQIEGLRGYVPEVEKHKAWVPGTTAMYGQQVALPRSPQQVVKSFRTAYETPVLADQAFHMVGGGRLERIQPTAPTTGIGVRQGWTQSTMILPGESAPRTGQSMQVVLGEQPDMPGAGYLSPSSGVIRQGLEEKYQLYSHGERGYAQYRFGVSNMAQLRELVSNKQLSIYNLEGRLVQAGTGKFTVGQWMEPDPNDPSKTTRQPIRMDQKGYDIRLSKPTLHIPKYYDPRTEGNMFSNLPVEYKGQAMTTDSMVDELRRELGNQINISQISAISGREGTGAEVYINAPIDRLAPVSYKTAGLKMYPVEAMEDMFMQFLGEDKPQYVDIFTQEGKIPTRSLMSSFGIMNLQTQLGFLREFLPHNTPREQRGLGSVVSYVKQQYRKGGQVGISAERMGQLYGEATGTQMSGDMFFKQMMQNILTIDDPKRAARVRERYMVGLPTEQMFGAMVYSRSQMEEKMRLIKELPPEAQNLIRFEKYKQGSSDSLDKLVQSVLGDEAGTMKRDLYMMKFKVPGGGANIGLQQMVSAVSEYPFQKGFINAKAIANAIQRFPEASMEMGLLGTATGAGKWLGSTEPKIGKIDPHVTGWSDLYHWMGFQSNLMEGEVSIPRETTVLNPELAAHVKMAYESAKGEPTTKGVLSKFRSGLEGISPELVGFSRTEGHDFTETMFLDPNSMNLLPKLSSIEAIESYGEGTEEGQTRTFHAQNYFNLLEEALQSVASEPGSRFAQMRTAAERFYNRIQKSWFPKGRRSKEISRHLTGARLPGMRGGRYQGLTQLEIGEAFASDDYIQRMLSFSGFKNRGQIQSIMNYMRETPGAYLPILTQRYPDVSGHFSMMPMKLRSRDAYKAMGVDVPSGATARDVMFMDTVTNRFFVGDFDADPASSKVLPIYNRKGIWKMPKNVQAEFDREFNLYSDVGNTLDQALTGMFGGMALAEQWEGDRKIGGPLDVDRMSLGEYAEVTGSNQSNLQSRLESIKLYDYKDILMAGFDVAGLKRGMGASYNRRTLTEDVADAVLRMNNKDVYSKAYESGATSYQMYLDQLDVAKGGFTELETMLQSFGIYNARGSRGNINYGVSFAKSYQGQNPELDQKSTWTKVAGSGLRESSYMLNLMMSHTARMPSWKEANAKLAWGWGTPGNAQAVFDALENPEGFMTELGFRPKDATRQNVLGQLLKQGNVGFNSPYYTSMAYRAVRRFSEREPGLMADPSIKIPWLGSSLMAVGDIAKTKEYQLMSTFDRLFLTGPGVVRPEEMQMLGDLGNERLSKIAGGIYASWLSSTGGMSRDEQASEEMAERMAYASEAIYKGVSAQTPVVHASEMGALAGTTAEVRAAGWRRTSASQRKEAAYGAAIRSLGVERLMSDAFGKGGIFQKIPYPGTRGAIEGGQTFERAFAEETELAHVGSVQKSKVLDFDVGGIKVRGIPDFVGYDETTKKFIIADTKSPTEREGVAYTPSYARGRAMTTRNRMQQLAYAYGIEKSAKTMDESGWMDMMKGWGVTDDETIRNMRVAASRGQFDISLVTGRVHQGTMTQFAPIPIPYGATERAEVETAASQISGNLFSPESRANVAGETYAKLLDPKGIPYDLSGFYRRRPKVMPDMRQYRFLDAFANAVDRMAGGGRMEGEEKRFRVGEGGPEEIIIKKSGEIEMVPTHDLAESRKARGEDVSREGYMGGRLNDANDDELLPVTFATQQETGASEPPTPPPPPPTTATASEPQFFGRFLEEFDNRLNRAEEIFSGRRASQRERVPSVKEGMGIRQNLGLFALEGGNIESFQREVSNIMIDAFQREGLGGREIRGMRGGVNASMLMTLAGDIGLPREAFMPEMRRRGLVEQSRGIMHARRAVEQITALEGRGVDIEGSIGAGFSPIERRAYTSLMDVVTGPRQEVFEQAGITAGIISQERSAQEMRRRKYAGATDASIDAYLGSIDKMTDAQTKLTEAQRDGLGVEEATTNLRRAELENLRDKRRMEFETAAGYAGAQFAPGRGGALEFVGRRRARQMLDEGQITPEEFEFGVTAGERQRQVAATERQMAALDISPGRELAGRVGRMSRRLLGGFGLMYMGSIANLLTAPGRMGYAESMQQQVMAEQVMGGRFGAYTPTMTPEMRLARARQSYGGFGQRTMAGMQARMLEESPGLVNLAGSAFTGAVGYGAASYFGGIASLPASWLTPLAAGVGLAAAVGMGAIQVAGAINEPELTGIQMARLGGRGAGRYGWGAESWGEAVQTGGWTRVAAEWETLVNPGGPIQQQEELMLAMGQFGREQGVGLRTGTMREMLAGRGLDRYAQTRAMSSYAQMIAQNLGTDQGATYQAIALGEDYGLRMTPWQGGGLEQFAAAMQGGVNLEQIALSMATTPGAGLGQIRSEAGLIQQRWLDQGLPSSMRLAEIAGGVERMGALGTGAPDLTGRMRDAFENILAGMSGAEFGLYGAEVGREERRRGMGLDYRGAEQFIGSYMEMTPEQRTQEMRMGKLDELITKTLEGLEQTFMAIGDVLPDMTQFAGMTQMQLGVVQAQAQQGMAVGQQLIMAGLAPGEAQLVGGALGGLSGMTPRMSQMYTGMMRGDRASFARYAQQNPFLARQMAGMTVAGAGGAPINMASMFMSGVNAEGQLTGGPWGVESIGSLVYSPLEMQTQIWGQPGSWEGQGFDAGLINALTEGGTRGGQRYQMGIQYQQQMAQAGIQARQLALQREYQPQFWAIQDQQRALGYEQTTWGFQMQQAQLDQSQLYFQQTTGLQQRQTQMQRGWQVQDWAFQDRTRAMQWGWRQEDYAEGIRFMTGRERMMAERGMGRETIMHDLEGEQIDKSRARQKDLWSLEDERFDIQMAHQNTLFDLQQENIDKQLEFFEERKRLETELTELQREYWEKNMQIQEDAMGVNAAYAAQMHSMQLTMLEMTEFTEDANNEVSRFNEDSMLGMYDILKEIDPVFKGYLDDLERQMEIMGGTTATPTGGGGPGTRRQHGGRVYPGETYSILEGGTPEIFKPDMTGTIIPLDDPWGASIVSPGGGESGPIRIVLKVGDETLIDRMLDRVDAEIVL